MLIAITGRKNSGKDTLFNIINYLMLKYKYTNTHEIFFDTFEKFINKNIDWQLFENKKFADKLKDIVCLLLDCTREQLEHRDFKEKQLGEEWWYYQLSQDKIVPRFHYINDYDNQMCEERYLVKLTPRILMQKIGTDLFRNQLHPNIWINSTFVNYDEKCDWIITDLRFQDELDKVKKNNGIIINLQRDICNDNLETHISEQLLFNTFNFIITNNSTIDDLIEQVEKKLFIEGQIHLQYILL